MNRFFIAPRSIVTLLILIAAAFVLLSFYSSLPPLPSSLSDVFSSSSLSSHPQLSCSPRAYANGSWVPRSPHTNRTYISDPRDALDFAGFEGCASSREYNWHIGSDAQEQWSRFERPGVMDWEWKVNEDECAIEPLEGEKLLRHLIRDGGWLLLGGMLVSHFFSKIFFCIRLLTIWV